MPPRKGQQNSFRVNQGNWGLFQPAPDVEYEDRRKIDRDLLKVTHWRGATKYVEINDILHKLRFTTPPTNIAQTFSSGDATPSVQGGGMFITAGTTAITDFDDGEVGDVLYIYANSSITITHGTPIQLNGDANYDMVAGDTLILAMWNDQVWHEMGRGGQGAGGGGAWNTTKQTANYTAADNDEVLCDTATTGAFTVTLPASPTGGERVRIIDSAGNFGSANLTVGRNANTIRGVASDLVISTNNYNYEFVFNGTDSDWEYVVYEPAQTPQGTKTATFVIGPSANSDSSTYDYVTDGTADDVQIQAAIDALPANGGRIILREGTYTIAAQIDVDSNGVVIEGMGSGSTVIGLASSLSIVMFSLSSGFSNISFKNLTFNGTSSGQTSGTIIRNTTSSYSSNVWIQNCVFLNAYTYAIQSYGDQTLIKDCVFSSCGGTTSAIVINNLAGANNNIVENCFFTGCGTTTVIVSLGALGSAFNNIVELTSAHNDYVFSQSLNCSGNTVIINGNAGASFKAFYQVGICSNNIITAVATTPAPNTASVGFEDCDVIANNRLVPGADGKKTVGIGIVLTASGGINPGDVGKVVGNVIQGTATHGINVNTTNLLNAKITITGNSIVEPGLETDNTYSGIFLQSAINVIVNSNFVIGKTAANQPAYGIREDSSSDGPNIITSNVVLNAATANISTQHASTVSANNITA